MRTVGVVVGLVALLFALPSAGCGSSFVQSQLSDPILTGEGQDEVVWWAEHRANERGYNDTRVVMCQRGGRPVCVRMRVEDR